MDKHIKKFIWAGVTLLIITVAFPFLIQFIYPEMSDGATLGDAYGTLNTLFSGLAFAGIIATILMQRKELEYQRNELILQRNEMRMTREEFLSNRITSVIYNQLERYEALVKSFEIISEERKTLSGNSAFVYLENYLYELEHAFIKDYNDTLENNRKKLSVGERWEKNIAIAGLLKRNEETLLNYAVPTATIVQVVQETLINAEGLGSEEMNYLKNLFFRNLGHSHFKTVDGIIDFYREYRELAQEMNSHPDIGSVDMVASYLMGFTYFRKVEFTKENLQDTKAMLRKHLASIT